MKSESQKLANKRYRERNKERVAEQHNLWRAKNKDKLNDYQKRYKEANSDRAAMWTRISRFRQYGLTLEEGEALFSGGCLVCGSVKDLCIDHCHKSGIVRGCLCNSCNSALGYLKESPETVIKMHDYIINRCNKELNYVRGKRFSFQYCK